MLNMMLRIRALLCASTLIAGVGVAVGQESPAPSSDPIELVAYAEGLFAKGEKEDAILLCWDAAEQLALRPGQPASAAALTAALDLLRTDDPLHAERLAVFLAQARAQAELAMQYRGKKWFRTALEHLDLADRLDAAASAKERDLVARAKPQYVDPSITEPRGYSLLQRIETVRALGPWREVGDTLECGPHVAKEPWHEWIIDQKNEDCELTVEFRSNDPKACHDCSILVGVDNTEMTHQFIAAYYPESGRFDLVLIELKGNTPRLLASDLVGSLPAADGFHRMSLRVHGTSLRAQLDSARPVEANVVAAPRGRFGIAIGINNQNSAPLTIRAFQSIPWPPPSDEELRASRHAAAQKRIAEAIDGASLLVARKEHEAAAHRLRVARVDAERLMPGVLRDKLAKSIDESLTKADPIQSRSKKVGQASVRAIADLADKYAAAGQVRAALRILQRAALIDTESCSERLNSAKEAVASWHQHRER